MTKDIELAWAAGFIDGEGTFRFQRNGRSIHGHFCMTAAQVDRRPLDRLQQAIGAGKVYGPYGPYQHNHQPHYQFNHTGPDAAEAFLLLRPYLGPIKQRQGDEAITTFYESENGPSSKYDKYKDERVYQWPLLG